jgi:gluconate kinase
MAFKLPYVYDYITKLRRQQAEVIQNHEKANVRNIGQGEPLHGKCKRLNLTAVKHTAVQVTRQTAVVAGATNDAI